MNPERFVMHEAGDDDTSERFMKFKQWNRKRGWSGAKGCFQNNFPVNNRIIISEAVVFVTAADLKHTVQWSPKNLCETNWNITASIKSAPINYSR